MSITVRHRRLSKGRISLFLDIYHAGARSYEFLNLYIDPKRKNRKEALQLAHSIAAKRQLELQNSEHGFIPSFKRQANFITFFERLRDSKTKGVYVWKRTAGLLSEFSGGSVQFSAITDRWLEEFKIFLVSKKLKPNSAHTYFSLVKAALNKAVKEDILITSPAARVPGIKKEEPQRTFLTLDEVQRLGATPCPENEVKRAFLFACYTGLRLSDIIGLTWAMVCDDRLDFRQKKTSGMEYLPLSKSAASLITHGQTNVHPLPESKVFTLPAACVIGTSIKQWCISAEIQKRVTFHTSRHTFATNLLTQGADLYTVSKLLGHRTIQVTQIYARVIDKKKSDAVSLLPDLQMANT